MSSVHPVVDSNKASHPSEGSTHLPAAQSTISGGYPIPVGRWAMQPTHTQPQEHLRGRDPTIHIQLGRWSAGLVECCDTCVPNTSMACCCPCVALAQVYARVELGRYHIVLARLAVVVVGGIVLSVVAPLTATSGTRDETYGVYYAGDDTISTSIYVVVVLLHFVFVLHIAYARLRVRRRFLILGSGVGDCVVSWLCSCCTIAQLASHVKSYKPGDCSFHAPDVLPPYEDASKDPSFSSTPTSNDGGLFSCMVLDVIAAIP